MVGRAITLLLAVAMLAPSTGLVANDNSDRRVHVKGYYRKDGTYVRPHTRSWPHSKSAYSAPPPFARPETSTPQGPAMYYNPFVQQRRDAQQNGSRNATPSDAEADAVTNVDRVYARKLLALLDEEDARCSILESGMQKFVDATLALRDTFNALRRQRGELRHDAEAVASGKANSTGIKQMHERAQSYVTTLNKQKACATLLGERAEEFAQHPAGENRPEKNSVLRPAVGNQDLKMARMGGAYTTQSDPEQRQRQAEFDTATAKFHSLFTTLVATAKAHQITKEEFATGIINVSLMQIELNKRMEAYNQQHPSQAVIIDARHTWYENVDHIVSEVIPRR